MERRSYLKTAQDVSLRISKSLSLLQDDRPGNVVVVLANEALKPAETEAWVSKHPGTP